ncbi:hypothetical protein GCM10029964_093640 [Kibdelosporangium lantanae]
MKVIVRMSALLRYAFYLVLAAVVLGLAMGHQGQDSSSSRMSSASGTPSSLYIANARVQW